MVLFLSAVVLALAGMAGAGVVFKYGNRRSRFTFVPAVISAIYIGVSLWAIIPFLKGNMLVVLWKGRAISDNPLEVYLVVMLLVVLLLITSLKSCERYSPHRAV